MGGLMTWLGMQHRTAVPVEPVPTETTPPAILPSRTGSAPLTTREAVAVPSAYRALQILLTSAGQLTIDASRGAGVIDNPPAIIRRPSLDLTRSAWIEACVMSLAVSGNLYLKPVRADRTVIDVQVLNPHHVTTSRDPRTGIIKHHHDGTTYTADQLVHCAMMRLPGALTGMGPIQAARAGLTFARDLSTHVAGWWDGSGQPNGLLTTDQAISDAQARATLNAWNGLDATGQPIERTANPSGVKVLGRGLHYEPILLKPADALWLEAQTFTALEVARLFGVPSSLMLVAPEGTSRVYSNVAQEWLAFVRFTLMGYLRPIEDALTDLVPHGMEARFNLEGLLRADTAARYSAHKVAAETGWLDTDEIRAIEGLPARVKDTADA